MESLSMAEVLEKSGVSELGKADTWYDVQRQISVKQLSETQDNLKNLSGSLEKAIEQNPALGDLLKEFNAAKEGVQEILKEQIKEALENLSPGKGKTQEGLDAITDGVKKGLQMPQTREGLMQNAVKESLDKAKAIQPEKSDGMISKLGDLGTKAVKDGIEKGKEAVKDAVKGPVTKGSIPRVNNLSDKIAQAGNMARNAATMSQMATPKTLNMAR